jgi:hypothetical protein
MGSKKLDIKSFYWIIFEGVEIKFYFLIPQIFYRKKIFQLFEFFEKIHKKFSYRTKKNLISRAKSVERNQVNFI